jgi:hypothetical protein
MKIIIINTSASDDDVSQLDDGRWRCVVHHNTRLYVGFDSEVLQFKTDDQETVTKVVVVLPAETLLVMICNYDIEDHDLHRLWVQHYRPSPRKLFYLCQKTIYIRSIEYPLELTEFVNRRTLDSITFEKGSFFKPHNLQVILCRFPFERI